MLRPAKDNHPAPTPQHLELTAPESVVTLTDPEQSIVADGNSASNAPTSPTFSMVAYTGDAMRVMGWRYPVVVDLSGLQIPSQRRPIRFAHSAFQGIGHTERIAVTTQGNHQQLVAEGVISRDTPAAREVVASGKKGFPWQASNPEVGLEFENFAGSGELSGADALETTIVLSQLIELGNKRGLRVKVAEEARQVSALDYEAQRLEVLVETAARFVRVLEVQQRVAFAERARDLAEENRRVIDRRVQAGDVSPIDEIKARLESESGRITVDRLKRELQAARRDLSAMWDEDEPVFTTAVGSLKELRDVPPLAVLAKQVDAHPEVKRWIAELERRTKAVELARAQAVPDVNAGLGVRYANDINDAALVGSISVPLNVFDRKQAGILTARLQAAQAMDEARATRRELATQLSREYGRLSAAYHEAQAIKSVLLPAARDAYDATRRAYEEGKTAYLGVLDAQRTLFDTESQHLEALAEYHAALVQVEGLISSPLSTITTDLLTTPPTTGDSP